ncbi:hypothetical protein [Micromonospora endolithica]|uniref:Uncharacterized protein n=1 Tax=Micromonospora endolithica TaxID=230091 RepID=A0A3A9ZJB0_9ACTN|nr:hypothetical protein [Micromonospora endolithica]RKN47517.1 hypothetical protein D7223_12080 [Micromonospora endolithica]TWJ21154.1 hypothetical protein JD76_01264 [Micromonospora endolithica]
MKLRLLYSTSSSSCPTIYIAEDGDIVVQGLRLDQETEGELNNVLAGETAVKISPQLLLGAAAEYEQRGRQLS